MCKILSYITLDVWYSIELQWLARRDYPCPNCGGGSLKRKWKCNIKLTPFLHPLSTVLYISPWWWDSVCSGGSDLTCKTNLPLSLSSSLPAAGRQAGRQARHHAWESMHNQKYQLIKNREQKAPCEREGATVVQVWQHSKHIMKLQRLEPAANILLWRVTERKDRANCITQ